MLWGIIRLWEKTGQQKYYDYVMEYVNFHVNNEGRVTKFTGGSMDDMMTGSVPVCFIMPGARIKSPPGRTRIRGARRKSGVKDWAGMG